MREPPVQLSLKTAMLIMLALAALMFGHFQFSLPTALVIDNAVGLSVIASKVRQRRTPDGAIPLEVAGEALFWVLGLQFFIFFLYLTFAETRR